MKKHHILALYPYKAKLLWGHCSQLFREAYHTTYTRVFENRKPFRQLMLDITEKHIPTRTAVERACTFVESLMEPICASGTVYRAATRKCVSCGMLPSEELAALTPQQFCLIDVQCKGMVIRLC